MKNLCQVADLVHYLQPGMFPSSLKAYVERALARCKDESQKSACQDIMKEVSGALEENA